MPIPNASKQLILGTVNANSKFRPPIPTSKRSVIVMQTSTSFEGKKILHDFVNCSALISLFPSKNNERKDSSNSQLLIWSRFAAEGGRRGSRRIQSLEAATQFTREEGPQKKITREKKKSAFALAESTTNQPL